MIVTILLVCISILLIYHYYTHHGRRGRLINMIPGEPIIPIIGNLLAVKGSREHIWNYSREINRKYYPIVRIWFFHYCSIYINHPDDMEIILNNTKYIEKGDIYNSILPWFGTGLLTSTGTKWHNRRKLLTPAFHFNILQEFTHIFLEESERMTKTLKNAKGSIVKDLLPFISHHTLNAICETAMGTSLESMSSYQQQYRQAVHDMGQVVIERIMTPWYYNDMIFSFTPLGRKQRRLLNILHEFTEKIIMERKRCHEDNNFMESSDIDDLQITGRKKRRLALLDLLIETYKKNQINDAGIKEEVDTFMFEGHDTVAMGACFALLLLAEHKDIQNRARNEINTVLEENGGKYSVSILQNLPYLEMCLKESLRLYPSVHTITRKLSEEVKLSSYTIPSGAELELKIYDLHRDSNFWPNPNVFDPERFLPENIQNRHPYSYIPFSAGPRNCIGQRFAMLELKAMVASLLHNFYLEPVDYLKNLQLQIDLVIRPTHPIRVKFIPVN